MANSKCHHQILPFTSGNSIKAKTKTSIKNAFISTFLLIISLLQTESAKSKLGAVIATTEDNLNPQHTKLIRQSVLWFPEGLLDGYEIFLKRYNQSEKVAIFHSDHILDVEFISKKDDGGQQLIIFNGNKDMLKVPYKNVHTYVVLRKVPESEKKFTAHLAYIRNFTGQPLSIEWDVYSFHYHEFNGSFASAFFPQREGPVRILRTGKNTIRTKRWGPGGIGGGSPSCTYMNKMMGKCTGAVQQTQGTGWTLTTARPYYAMFQDLQKGPTQDKPPSQGPYSALFGANKPQQQVQGGQQYYAQQQNQYQSQSYSQQQNQFQQSYPQQAQPPPPANPQPTATTAKPFSPLGNIIQAAPGPLGNMIQAAPGGLGLGVNVAPLAVLGVDVGLQLGLGATPKPGVTTPRTLKWSWKITEPPLILPPPQQTIPRPNAPGGMNPGNFTTTTTTTTTEFPMYGESESVDPSVFPTHPPWSEFRREGVTEVPEFGNGEPVPTFGPKKLTCFGLQSNCGEDKPKPKIVTQKKCALGYRCKQKSFADRFAVALKSTSTTTTSTEAPTDVEDFGDGSMNVEEGSGNKTPKKKINPFSNMKSQDDGTPWDAPAAPAPAPAEETPQETGNQGSAGLNLNVDTAGLGNTLSRTLTGKSMSQQNTGSLLNLNVDTAGMHDAMDQMKSGQGPPQGLPHGPKTTVSLDTAALTNTLGGTLNTALTGQQGFSHPPQGFPQPPPGFQADRQHTVNVAPLGLLGGTLGAVGLHGLENSPLDLNVKLNVPDPTGLAGHIPNVDQSLVHRPRRKISKEAEASSVGNLEDLKELSESSVEIGLINPILDAEAEASSGATRAKKKDSEPQDMEKLRVPYVGVNSCPYKTVGRDVGVRVNHVVDFFLKVLRVDCLPFYKRTTMELFEDGLVKLKDTKEGSLKIVLNRGHPLCDQKMMGEHEWMKFASGIYISTFSRIYFQQLSLYDDSNDKFPEGNQSPNSTLISGTAKTLTLFVFEICELMHTTELKHSVKMANMLLIILQTQRTEIVIAQEEFLTFCDKCLVEKQVNFNDQVQLYSLMKFIVERIDEIVTRKRDDDFSIEESFNKFYTDNFKEIEEFVQNKKPFVY